MLKIQTVFLKNAKEKYGSQNNDTLKNLLKAAEPAV